MSSKPVLVELLSWARYNPRNDAKKWSWFRFQNDFFEDDDVFDLTAHQKLLLIYLFTRRSKAALDVFSVKTRHVSRYLDCSEAEILEGLAALVGLGKIKLNDDVRERTDPYADVRERTDPYPTDGQTDVRTNEQDTDRQDKARPPSGGPPVVSLVNTWNTHRGPLDAVKSLSPVKDAQARARLRENPDLGFWEGVVKRLAASLFATGKIPTKRRPNGWRASFQWLIAEADHATKVAAGEYDDATAPKKPLKLLTAEDLHT